MRNKTDTLGDQTYSETRTRSMGMDTLDGHGHARWAWTRPMGIDTFG